MNRNQGKTDGSEAPETTPEADGAPVGARTGQAKHSRTESAPEPEPAAVGGTSSIIVKPTAN